MDCPDGDVLDGLGALWGCGDDFDRLGQDDGLDGDGELAISRLGRTFCSQFTQASSTSPSPEPPGLGKHNLLAGPLLQVAGKAAR